MLTTAITASIQEQSHLACAYHRVLKLARTIADLAGADSIGSAHLAEAFQYRPRRVESVPAWSHLRPLNQRGYHAAGSPDAGDFSFVAVFSPMNTSS
ncbi:MAG TPA: hypothetical protein VF909_02645 [Roseiflexaceae bacterium]